jgi:alkylation response protein AidB-like acyl-CoA dehydrogenase
MTAGLTPTQAAARASFESFAERSIAPQAAEFDRAATVPASLLADLAARGHFGLGLPASIGGCGDLITLGLFHAEIGRVSQSVRSILTAHHMVAHAVMRWGTSRQREVWGHDFAAGRRLAAFCLSEPAVGSDARRVDLHAERTGAQYVLTGEKSWITAGQIADAFLVIAQCESSPVAFLVSRDSPGVTVNPLRNLLGTRASMLADLTLDRVVVAADQLVGRAGFGISHVAAAALDVGRYCVAWGCAGLLEACLDASIRHARERRQFGEPLIEHQLIRRMLSEMTADARATRLLVLRAGALKDEGAPEAVLETVIAKYFAARAAARAARRAVQIHGARGCLDDSLVARCYRDAKIMEIIEGSNEMGELGIAGWSLSDD